MSNNSLNIIETSRRYAKAIQLAVNHEKKKIETIKTDFENFSVSIKKISELNTFLQTPLINSKDKSKILRGLFKKLNFSNDFENFLITLTNHGKLFLVNKVYEEFIKLLDKNEGIIEVDVTTVEPLDRNVEDKIIKKLSQKLNKKIRLKKIVNKEIIGGIILKINSIMIDNSIKSKLLEYNISERLK